MLLVFMGLLNMVGGNVPPPPPTPDHGGGSGGKYHHEETEVIDRELENKKWKDKLIQDDEDLIIIIASWLANKNNN